MSQQDAGPSVSRQQQKVKIVLLGIDENHKENKGSKCHSFERDGRTYICTPKAESFRSKDILDLMAHILHPWPDDLPEHDIYLMAKEHLPHKNWKERLGGCIYENIKIYNSDQESMKHLAGKPYTPMQFVKDILSPRLKNETKQTPGDQEVEQQTSSGNKTGLNHQVAERARPVQQKSGQHGKVKRWYKKTKLGRPKSSNRDSKRPGRAGPGQQESEHREAKKLVPYKHGGQRSSTHDAENRAVQPRNFNLVLLGESGSGKSSSGNTILGRKAFLSKASSRAITIRCEEKLMDFHDSKVKIIDTPDFFDEDLKQHHRHLKQLTQMYAGWECVYLLVIQIGRFTEGERDILERLEKEMGPIRHRTIILFTHGDDLDQISIHEYLDKTNPHLQSLIGHCGRRYHVFNNKERNEQQVEGLLWKINEQFCLVKAAGHSQSCIEI